MNSPFPISIFADFHFAGFHFLGPLVMQDERLERADMASFTKKR